MRIIEDATREVATDGDFYYKKTTDPSWDPHIEAKMYALMYALETPVVNGALVVPNLGTRIDSIYEHIGDIMRELETLRSLATMPAHADSLPSVDILDPVESLRTYADKWFQLGSAEHKAVTTAINDSSFALSGASGFTWCHGDVNARNVVMDHQGRVRLINWESMTIANRDHDVSAMVYFDTRRAFREALIAETDPYGGRTDHKHMSLHEHGMDSPVDWLLAQSHTGSLFSHSFFAGGQNLSQGSLLYYWLRSTSYRMGLSGGGPDAVDRALARAFRFDEELLAPMLAIPGEHLILFHAPSPDSSAD